MIRTFKYPLLPNSRQERVLSGWLELNRQLYNAGLEQRREAYRLRGKTLTYFTQTKELTELRAADERYKTVPVEISRSALRTLHRAFDGFFRRVKAGDKPGYPRFRGRERYDSFNIGRATVRSNRVYVPKLGGVKFNRYRDVEGIVRDVTLRKKNGKWFVCISCDLGEAPQKIPVAKAVGIDLGLTSFAALSDGSVIENPRYFKAGQESLAVRQRKLACKRHGSNSRQRARILVGKSYEHIHNQRLDFSRKLAKELFNRFDLIAYEDLNISAMVQSHLSKSISDASWKIFIGALNNRAENAGRWAVPVNPRNTTKTCSRCGNLVPKDLSERVHSCSCGLVLDRDINAAINILALGKSAVAVSAEGSH